MSDNKEMWRIWFQHFDRNGNPYAAGVSIEKYAYKRNAVRAAKKKWGTDFTKTKWIVSQTNPWAEAAPKYNKDAVMSRLMATIS